MFDFFDNRDKCHKPGFLRGNTYTSCISMVLLDHFANKSNTFLSPSLALPFPPIYSFGPPSSYPGYRDTAIKGTLVHLSLFFLFFFLLPNILTIGRGGDVELAEVSHRVQILPTTAQVPVEKI